MKSKYLAFVKKIIYRLYNNLLSLKYLKILISHTKFDSWKRLFSLTFTQQKWFVKDFENFVNQSNEHIVIRPIVEDKFQYSGILSGHYFYQDIIVAQAIFSHNPDRHIDIGSRTDGFVAHVASFRQIEVFDIRPNKTNIGNIKFVQRDFMDPNIMLDGYADSVSSLHALEHFGLGRYGDHIDAEGFNKAFINIYRLLKVGGMFYFSVPIGPSRVEFNAHRVFSVSRLLEIINPLYSILEFSYVDDNGDLFKNVELTDKSINNNFGCTYGCGIWFLKKR